jgi:hypothetical protein
MESIRGLASNPFSVNFMLSIRNKMDRAFAFQRSLIGKKFIVALTGFVGAVYVLTHMLGIASTQAWKDGCHSLVKAQRH